MRDEESQPASRRAPSAPAAAGPAREAPRRREPGAGSRRYSGKRWPAGAACGRRASSRGSWPRWQGCRPSSAGWPRRTWSATSA
eukprot:5202443-Pyramimonas_sp.AAC.1